MTESCNPEIEFEHEDFEFVTLEEELQVNERCQQLLKHFYLYLQQQGMDTERSSELAFSADLYLRDYLLDFARQNVVQPQPGIIKKFAASWFITHTLDPEMSQLEQHLTAIVALYRYLREQHFISLQELAVLEAEAAQVDYFKERIATFLALSGDGFAAWDAECPAKF
jgi:hypothetical protein